MSYERFAKYVSLALEQLDSLYLVNNPLSGLLVTPGEPATGDALRCLLLQAIESLNPSRAGPGWEIAIRRYQHLILRYERGATTEQVCASLGVSARQARRDHHEAVEALSRYLWQRYRQAHPTASDRSSGYPASADRVQPASSLDNLDSELDLLAPSMKSDLNTDLAPIPEITSSALATVARLAEARSVVCRSDVGDDVADLLVARSAIRQVLILLLAFAIETEGVTAVTLRLRSVPDGVSISIDAAIKPGSPTSPLLRPNSLETDDRLRASGRLIETLGGAFQVGATNGAAFQFLVRVPPAPMSTVLAVDDNPDMLRLLSRYLVGTRYRLLTATTAERALQLVATANPAAVLLDLMMPTQDGWEMLEEIQRRPDAPRTSVIVCSVLGERELALSLGAADFLHKPVTRSALLTTLSRLVRVA